MKSDRAAMEDLKRETRRALELTHSNIIRIYDFVEDNVTAAIAMEYVPGDTLSNRRMDRPSHVFEPADLGRWVWQLCEALTYAHEKARIVHRDLKPANLMLDAHGDLKVADFGIARSISDSVSRLSAQAGSSGTPAYMSPQQMMGEKPGVADDIYALGATLYELLTGKPPFHSGNLIAQVQGKVPPSVAERRAELEIAGEPLPPAWEETIAACLAKDAAARPATAREVARRLGLGPTHSTAPFAAATGGSRPPVPGKKPVAAKPPASSRRVPLPAVATMVALLLGLAGAGYYYGLYRPQQEEAARRETEAKARQQAENNAREAANRATDELRQKIAAGQATPAELEIIAQEQTPRGALARERLQVLQREREQAEQQANQVMLVALERLADNAPRPAFDELDQQVRAYLAAAPERYRAEVQKNWDRRRTAWLAYEAANRPGSLMVESDPPGATVTLYPRNERKTSPAVFKDLKPGEVSYRVEKDGYAPQDITYQIKAGTDHRVEPVRLAPLYGSATVTSTPTGLAVTFEGNNRRYEGRTPFTQENLAPGAYRATFQRADWQPVEKSFVVEKGREAVVTANLQGVALWLRTTPAGASVQFDGRAVGVTPLQLKDLEPRSHRVEFALEGYERLQQNVTPERDGTLDLVLTELPGYRLLHALSEHPWRCDVFWGNAQLTFDQQGNIRGEHKIPLAAVMQDVGRVVRTEENGTVLVANFTPSTPYPFYVGDVKIRLLADNSIEVTFLYNGHPQRLIYVQPGTQAVKMKR